jgi:hypothetical protein
MVAAVPFMIVFRLLHVLVKERKVPNVITGLAATTVVAGWIMWLRDMNLKPSLGDWLASHYGFVLTIRAVLATIAFFLGYFGVGKNVERLVDLSDEVAASGGPPSPEQQTAIQHIGAELEKPGKLDLILLLLAVVAMATAQTGNPRPRSRRAKPVRPDRSRAAGPRSVPDR